MNSWRAGLLLLSTLAVAFGTTSLWAKGETPELCCADLSDCGGKICCPWDWVSSNICDSEHHDFCVVICIRPGDR